MAEPFNPDDHREALRLRRLHDLAILDTGAEREFDNLTRLAATALRAQSAAISLIDRDRQWFKARHGLDDVQTTRDIAFCSHTLHGATPLVVLDAAQDPRFADNPLVKDRGTIRFYAGAPLILPDGHCLGALCVFDPQPRDGVTATELALLSDLARIAIDLIESRQERRLGEIAAEVAAATSDAVVASDRDGKIVYWNDAAAQLFGRERNSVLGKNVELIIPARSRARHAAMLAKAASGRAGRLIGTTLELLATHRSGEEIPVELSLARWGDSGAPGGFAAIMRDVRQRKAMEEERQYAQSFLNAVVDNLPGMLFVKDVETRRYVRVNRAGEALVGRPLSEVIGATDVELFPDQGHGYEQRDSDAIAASAPTVFESRFQRDSGETVHLRTTRTLIDGPDRPRQYLLGVSEDVTAIREAESAVLQLAHYDALTGLLNRASFTDKLRQLVSHDRPFCLLSVDLDRFKAINDQFGHLVGDEVLTAVAHRLRDAVGTGGWIARIGGDEFMIGLEGEEPARRAQGVAEAVISRLAEPFDIRRTRAHCGASIGGVVWPRDGQTEAQLRENVDLALYRAKHSGKGVACFFNTEMDAAARDRRNLERDLRLAIAADAIHLAYQPVVSAETGLITSAEALARWTHPERGPIPPDVFISIAEECGLVGELGARLLERACRDATAWPAHLKVAVNLSPLQFIAGDLVDVVRTALESTGLAPSRLQLEVTEGLLLRDGDATLKQLKALRRLGIQILMDDFGVGYSSLGYFNRFPFDKVKIDKSFVDQVTTSKSAKAIVQAVIGLGAALRMGVVAEGVETAEQHQVLVACGCTHFQGYLFSRPVAAHHIRALATTRLPIAPATTHRLAG